MINAQQTRGTASTTRPKQRRRSVFATAGVLLAALSLAACEKTAPSPPTPTTAPTATPAATPASVDPAVTAGAASAADPAASTSVPAAEAVLPSTTAAPKADQSPGRTDTAITPAQESSTMPMPGQVNDHSLPRGPTQGASRP